MYVNVCIGYVHVHDACMRMCMMLMMLMYVCAYVCIGYTENFASISFVWRASRPKKTSRGEFTIPHTLNKQKHNPTSLCIIRKYILFALTKKNAYDIKTLCMYTTPAERVPTIIQRRRAGRNSAISISTSFWRLSTCSIIPKPQAPSGEVYY